MIYTNRNENKNAVKEKYFYRYFTQKFNLHFKPPDENLKIEKELHLRRAEKSARRTEKRCQGSLAE